MFTDPKATHLRLRPSRPDVREGGANDLYWAAIAGRLQSSAPLAVAGGLRFEATGVAEVAVRQGANPRHAGRLRRGASASGTAGRGARSTGPGQAEDAKGYEHRK